MTMTLTKNSEIQQLGIEALLNALGPIDTAKFLDQYSNGTGDYTKEKYDQPDYSLEEIMAMDGI